MPPSDPAKMHLCGVKGAKRDIEEEGREGGSLAPKTEKSGAKQFEPQVERQRG